MLSLRCSRLAISNPKIGGGSKQMAAIFGGDEDEEETRNQRKEAVPPRPDNPTPAAASSRISTGMCTSCALRAVSVMSMWCLIRSTSIIRSRTEQDYAPGYRPPPPPVVNQLDGYIPTRKVRQEPGKCNRERKGCDDG